VKGLTVAAAQSVSVRGDVDDNVARHLRLVSAAASHGVDLLVFPELSLTGYELDLGPSLQMRADDARLEPLRHAAREHRMHLMVSAPWISGRGRPYLGAFLIGPDATIGYAKIYVHESEAPYFMRGSEHRVVTVADVPIGLAICADTSHPVHAGAAAGCGSRLYAACVMKVEAELRAHASKMRQYARTYRMATLSANYGGVTGGERSAGRSAVWNEDGELVARAGPAGEALVVARREGGRWRGEVVTAF
jgi:predicted amidohydrolase